MNSVLLFVEEMFTLTKMKSLVVFITSIVSAFVGGFDVMVEGLIIALSMDYILGLHWAWLTGTFSNKKGTLGIMKVFYIVCAIGLSVQIDLVIFHSSIEWGFHNLMVTLIFIKTALDVLHKFVRLNVPIPKQLIDKLQYYYDNIDLCRRATDINDPSCMPIEEDITNQQTNEKQDGSM